MRPHWQISLKTLCLATCGVCVAAAGLGWLRTEFVGRLETEGPVGSGPSPSLVFACASGEDAKAMARSFDRDAILSDFSRFFLQPNEEPSKAVDVSVATVEIPNHFVIKYDYQRWGRQRLNLWRFRFEFDMDDPVARERNRKIEMAFIRAAKHFAEQHPTCDFRPELSHATES